MDRLDKQIEFILEVDKLKDIVRQNYIADGSRKENDTEHSWHMALMCALLSEYSNQEIDIAKTMLMLLIHDIVEIDAGDTYAYDEASNITKNKRELDAADRIFNILPDDQAVMLRSIWDEFEKGDTAEAKFAASLDRIQPILLNDASKGKSWKEHGVKLSQIINRNKKTADGSKTLWNYVENIINKNLEKGIIICDKSNGNDQILDERYKKAITRIRLIKKEEIIDQKYRGFFKDMTQFIEKVDEIYKLTRENKIVELDITELGKLNKDVYCNILEDKYQDSYFNPTYVVGKLGGDIGKSILLLSSELLYLIEYAYKGKSLEIIIILELFIKIYDCFKIENEVNYKSINQIIYDYYFKNTDLITEGRIIELIDPSYKFYYNIIMNSDLNDLSYLYYYGKNITDNELKTAKFINTLSDEEVKAMAFTYTEGFRKGFISNNIDLRKKEVVNIRFFIGFERIVKQAILNFQELGLEPTFTVSTTSANRQYYYDHRYDMALYYDEALKERKLESLKLTLEKYKNIAIKYAGPAVIEVFGEELFSPIDKKENLRFNYNQQKLYVDYNQEANLINNIYIKRSETSFTIIAYPTPDIGERYEEIFRETVKVNTLDAELYQEIQQVLIDTLDQGDYLKVKGKGKNKTDIKVMLYPLANSDKETKFENCVADVNIPVGEVFTSPVLKGTQGLLHVPKIHLKGLEYKELELHFKDGMIVDYTCKNFDNEDSNKRYIKENLMNNHDSLPIGEFAIGTNTRAYVMGRKYDIQEKLPILIAEKTGPHFAIGDTCYNMSEDTKVFNPDGKEIIAKDNEISILRKTAPEKAYLNCHTDITLPYDELKGISVYKENGEKIEIIKNGRFVLSGTEELNKALDEN